MSKHPIAPKPLAHNIKKAHGLAVLTLVSAFLAAPALAQDPSAPRQKVLIYQLIQDCGSCHGSTLKGGLGPALLPGNLKGKDAEVLAAIILNGVPGTPMPPWRFEINEDEALWLARRIKEGVADEH
ncbi:c-type cytochrome [Varunaivibrio sulfuroxidans]|uniref:Cytochrome c55X n=1 Tax=Varunaivibrio sulfuroxidans TaxID=1773489 RepID=A0A4R3J9T5_9PROT|nr:cytochrome c [Varunaivibrio sulfuroxidans]TCS61786.1 cytochrome c55X [Varunaivibrio sulfuroxidans]WES32031.1 cytochrome c [Varunaivibrio sulfuroxidans]